MGIYLCYFLYFSPLKLHLMELWNSEFLRNYKLSKFANNYCNNSPIKSFNLVLEINLYLPLGYQAHTSPIIEFSRIILPCYEPPLLNIEEIPSAFLTNANWRIHSEIKLMNYSSERDVKSLIHKNLLPNYLVRFCTFRSV